MDGLSAPHTKAGRLQRVCLALLREHEADGAIPTSIRFLFYELVSRGIIPKEYPRKPDGTKKSRTPAQDVSAAVTHLREASLIPWDWIVDETRSLHNWRYAESVYQYVEDILPSSRINLWGGWPPPMILCESRSLAGVLRDIAAEYLCPIAATNGQAGGFLHTNVGPLIRDSETREVIYFGDLDLSGSHIEDNTRKVQSEYGDLDWIRLAITDVQVHQWNLTRVEKLDRRYNPPRTFPAVETEALSQQEIQRVLRETLNDALPQPLAEIRERQKLQRDAVRETLRSGGLL